VPQEYFFAILKRWISLQTLLKTIVLGKSLSCEDIIKSSNFCFY